MLPTVTLSHLLISTVDVRYFVHKTCSIPPSPDHQHCPVGFSNGTNIESGSSHCKTGLLSGQCICVAVHRFKPSAIPSFCFHKMSPVFWPDSAPDQLCCLQMNFLRLTDPIFNRITREGSTKTFISEFSIRFTYFSLPSTLWIMWVSVWTVPQPFVTVWLMGYHWD